MAKKTGSFKNKSDLKKIFEKTFSALNKLLPKGIVRGNRTNITPIVLFEAITIGTADILSKGLKISGPKLEKLLDDSELNRLTTGATNSKTKLAQRINYVSKHATL